MPKINILDTDYTTAVGNITSAYGVFVPGLPGSGALNPPTIAKEYTSLAAFKKDVGSAPTIMASGFVDLGYIYACELLGAGLPVIYKVVPINTTYTMQRDAFTETFVNGTTALTKMPGDNVTPGETNLVDSIQFYLDAEGSTLVVFPQGTTVTVNAEKQITITLGGSGSDIPDIKLAVYGFKGDGYVDPATISEVDVCKAIAKDNQFFGEIVDRGLYDVSFVTTGGYPTIYKDSGSTSDTGRSSLISALTAVCTARGDCAALVDFDVDTQIKLDNNGQFVDQDNKNLSSLLNISASEGPQDVYVIVPWCAISPNFSGYATTTFLPGSFAYLKAFAGAIRTNNSWFATAGVRRGAVACSGVTQVITNAEADEFQPVTGRSINAITFIKPYGYVIYGNRTLIANDETGLVANSFINVRQLVHDIKRQAYAVAKSLMFDPNDDILWVNFKNAITPLLEKMRSGQGIRSYRLVKIASSARGTMTAKIIISPIEAVETFNITVELTDEDVAVVG